MQSPESRPSASSLPVLPRFGLAELAQAIGAELSGPGDGTVTGISHVAQQVSAGQLWVALPGQRTHGARFAAQAAAGSPAAVLTDRTGSEIVRAESATAQLPVLITDQPQQAMAAAAAVLMGEPATQLLTFGVTGTNGKTTTAFMIDACLRAAGRRTGLIGTVGFLLDGTAMADVRTTTVTTPESPELQHIFATMVARGAEAMTMEVSSHALALHRADAVIFDVAGFNNLGVDHLDFHHTVAEYFEAKAQLFTPDHARRAVINIDDDHGRTLAERVRAAGELSCLTVSSAGAAADVVVRDVEVIPGQGTAFTVDVRRDGAQESHQATLSLPGQHNLANAALAIGMLAAAGLDLADCLPGLTTVGVPGRMEQIALPSVRNDADPRTPRVVVDFAHTPTAVGAACAALTQSATGPLVVVVGSGGDRDPSKRAPIGAEAARQCDVLVIADDNPRTEDPASVRAQILIGAEQAVAEGARARQVIDGGDRRAAVRLALELARDLGAPGAPATVAILGKGHETGQQIGDQVLPYTDADAAQQGWAQIIGGQHR